MYGKLFILRITYILTIHLASLPLLEKQLVGRNDLMVKIQK